MSFSQRVTNKAGQEKTVIADTEAELKAAVQAVKDEKAPQTVDINIPVRKGRDLLIVEEDAVTQGLGDGRGAHNSPRNAITDDNKVEGDPDVPVLVQKRGLNTSDTTNESLEKVVGEQETAEYAAEDAERAEKATLDAQSAEQVDPAPSSEKAGKKTSKKSDK